MQLPEEEKETQKFQKAEDLFAKTEEALGITKDEDGNTLYTDASRSDNGNASTDLSGTAYIWSGNTTVTIAFSTALSSNTATFDVKVEYTSTIF